LALDLDDVGIPESHEEEGLEVFETFEENALAKARFFRARTTLPVVSDDSGLEVLALGGQPGVRSKRWSGRSDLTGQALDDANNERLLAALHMMDDRRARYVCVAALFDGSSEWTFRGETSGRILRARVGSGGFGYDPYFFSDELGKSFGEASLEEKELVSHRGRAFRSLMRWLSNPG
jgi:XTP/dITP diphosphohydrolase